MRDVWDKTVREEPAPTGLTDDEQEQLRQLMQTKVFMRAARLVYSAVAQATLAKLGNVDADAKLLVEFNRSPDVVFGHLLEMCNADRS